MTQRKQILREPVSIREAAAASALPAKTTRYYEEIGLVRPARAGNGYRLYGRDDIETLRFLQRARSLGFSVEDCRVLLSLYRDRGRASADVKAVAERHMDEIDRKIAELAGMRRTLAHLAAACHGDDRPECPILEDMVSGGDA